MNLMIVESPNKIKKIKAILGSGWDVAASVGHRFSNAARRLFPNCGSASHDPSRFISPRTPTAREKPLRGTCSRY